jgi:hypothetical protein
MKLKQENCMSLDRGFNDGSTKINFSTYHGRDKEFYSLEVSTP